MKLEKPIKFKGKFCQGEIYSDKSGYLVVESPKYIKNGFYSREDGGHKDRVNDIKLLAEFYTKAYKELIKLTKNV